MGILLDNNSQQQQVDLSSNLNLTNPEAVSQQGAVQQRAINPNSIPANQEALKDRSVVENAAKAVVPSLPSPGSGGGFVASLGSQVAGLIVEMGAELRKQNQDRTASELQSVLRNIQDQVDGMMQQSKLGLGMSIASGVVGMAMGVGFSAGGVKDLQSGTGDLAAEAVQASKLTLGKEILQGIVNTMDGAKESQLTAEGAGIKSEQAEETQAQHAMESMKSFADNMKQLIETALSTAREMVSSTNAATQRILA